MCMKISREPSINIHIHCIKQLKKNLYTVCVCQTYTVCVYYYVIRKSCMTHHVKVYTKSV